MEIIPVGMAEEYGIDFGSAEYSYEVSELDLIEVIVGDVENG